MERLFGERPCGGQQNALGDSIELLDFNTWVDLKSESGGFWGRGARDDHRLNSRLQVPSLAGDCQ